jgi:hypothetical protein
MSKDAEVRMRMANFTDTPTVSTILEEMFRFFDDPLRRQAPYKAIKEEVRLTLALMVFGDSDYAELDETARPTPMVVPTDELLELLEIKKLTTNVKPLVMAPIVPSICQQKASLHSRYIEAFRSSDVKKDD